MNLYINNCPTICNTKQSIYYSASSFYMFRVSHIPIIKSTQNCNYSLRYWSYFLCSYLPPTWPSLTTLERGSCTVPEAVVTVLCIPDDGYGWHPKPDLYLLILHVALMILQHFCDLSHTATPCSNASFLQDISHNYRIIFLLNIYLLSGLKQTDCSFVPLYN